MTDSLRPLNAFHEAIYAVLRQIPAGRVINYGRLALLAGYPGAARGVGQALHALDELYDDVPWWRVINHAGRISTSCPQHTASVQRERLEAEGIHFNQDGYINWKQYGWIETGGTIAANDA